MSELAEFYIKVAPQCRRLAKKGSYWYAVWICKVTQRPCSAKGCPDRPDLADLIKTSAPEPLQQAAELAVGTPGNASLLVDEPGSEAPSPAGLSGESTPDLPDLKPASQQNEASPSNIEVPSLLANKPGPLVQISRSARACEDRSIPTIPTVPTSFRRTAKSHSKPRVHSPGRLKRAMITFTRPGDQMQRWAFDALFLPQRRRKIQILQFAGSYARFFFPLETSDEVAKLIIGSWFEKLTVHYETASMGSPMPTPYSIDFQEEDVRT